MFFFLLAFCGNFCLFIIRVVKIVDSKNIVFYMEIYIKFLIFQQFSWYFQEKKCIAKMLWISLKKAFAVFFIFIAANYIEFHLPFEEMPNVHYVESSNGYVFTWIIVVINEAFFNAWIPNRIYSIDFDYLKNVRNFKHF